jgi:hypothetical protein
VSEFRHEPQVESSDVVEAVTPQIGVDVTATPTPSDVGAEHLALPPLPTGGRQPRHPPSRADLDPDWRRGLRQEPSSSDAPPTRSGRGGPRIPTSRADADPDWRRRDQGEERPVMPSSSRGRGQGRGRGGRGLGGDGGDGKLRAWLKKKGDAEAFTTPDSWPTTLKVLQRAQRRLGAPAITDLQVAASSGSCLTFLYPGATEVVQHFTPKGMDSPRRAYRVIEMMREEGDPRLKNLAEIIDLDMELRMIVVERIQSLNQRFDLLKEGNGLPSPRDFLADTDEMERLVADIATAATALSEYLEVRQNDERLDNVGFKNGNYALYDYGMTNRSGLSVKEDVTNATGVIKGSITKMWEKHGVRH